jgi:hypothetical protein
VFQIMPCSAAYATTAVGKTAIKIGQPLLPGLELLWDSASAHRFLTDHYLTATSKPVGKTSIAYGRDGLTVNFQIFPGRYITSERQSLL